MGLALVVLAAAVLLGRLAGGSLGRLAGVRARAWPLLLAAATVQLAAVLAAMLGLPAAAYGTGLAVSTLLVLGFLTANRHRPGVGLIGTGLLLNALVVAANGAMPVELAAADRAGARVTGILDGSDARHEPATPDTRLRPLDDRVPVPLPLRPEVASPGDVLVAAGLDQLVFSAMRPPVGRRERSTGLPGPVRGSQR